MFNSKKIDRIERQVGFLRGDIKTQIRYTEHIKTKVDNQGKYIEKLERQIERIGTITPAPTELIDGGAYMFNSHNTKLLDAIGLYEENNNRFYFNGSYADLAYCSFIRLMSVESK